MKDMLDKGVDGTITDYPDRLKDIVNGHSPDWHFKYTNNQDGNSSLKY